MRSAFRPSNSACSISVHLLVSSETANLAIVALKSFELHTDRRWMIVIHDDGSVTEKQRTRMEYSFPDLRFIPREEADANAKAFLAKHPGCLVERLNHPFMLKFFDPFLFAVSEKYISMDADIVFFRLPTEILEWAKSKDFEYRLMTDARETYCCSVKKIEDAMHLSMLPAVNGGLGLVVKRAISLDLCERFILLLGKNARYPEFIEQTLCALSASAFKCASLLPKTYQITWNILRCHNCVCRHYIGASKKDLFFIEGANCLFLALIFKRIRNFFSL